MATTSFKDLIVWKKSRDLAVKVYKITDQFPKSEIYGCCIDEFSRKTVFFRLYPAIFRILSMALHVESACFLAITVPGNDEDGL